MLQATARAKQGGDAIKAANVQRSPALVPVERAGAAARASVLAWLAQHQEQSRGPFTKRTHRRDKKCLQETSCSRLRNEPICKAEQGMELFAKRTHLQAEPASDRLRNEPICRRRSGKWPFAKRTHLQAEIREVAVCETNPFRRAAQGELFTQTNPITCYKMFLRNNLEKERLRTMGFRAKWNVGSEPFTANSLQSRRRLSLSVSRCGAGSRFTKRTHLQAEQGEGRLPNEPNYMLQNVLEKQLGEEETANQQAAEGELAGHWGDVVSTGSGWGDWLALWSGGIRAGGAEGLGKGTHA